MLGKSLHLFMSLLVRLLLGRHFDRAAQRAVRTARVITFVITDDCVVVPSTLRQRCGNAASTLRCELSLCCVVAATTHSYRNYVSSQRCSTVTHCRTGNGSGECIRHAVPPAACSGTPALFSPPVQATTERAFQPAAVEVCRMWQGNAVIPRIITVDYAAVSGAQGSRQG